MKEKNTNPVKDILNDSGKVLAAWAQAASSITAEVLASSGMDIIMVDMEHGPGDFKDLLSQLQAMNGYNATPFVRAPWNDFVQIKRILDTGVYGVLVPYVETADEAQKAVAAVKYPPHGVRGVAGSTRAAHYGNESLEYFKKANREVMIFIAIESKKGYENIDEILAVEELDGVFIGPVDLATNLGYLGNPGNPEVQKIIEEIEEKVIASGKILMGIGNDWSTVQKKFDKGAQIVICMSDTTSLGTLARSYVGKFKEQYR
ncbi:aldolase/citrate lyase family protein [Marispirochaeta aestuarii]|uniref:HpcH/HpaI aldolase family protein n=1 Tax=Marispirochaeta aestuarii TaxID=1963862 RepID=UPI0029C906CC|nr:aldolase/citrate lyase family protein [Marispirochaeta aestuarii]